jgi:hypothetical protein
VLTAEITGKVTNIRKDCDKHQKVLFKESDISNNRCSLDLDVPKTMVQNVLHKHPRLEEVV